MRSILNVELLKLALISTGEWLFSKIHRYSPAESAKVFEKSMNRKHVGTFNPKVTLERLKMDSPTETHTEEHKRNLVQQYLEVWLCECQSVREAPASEYNILGG